MILFLNHNIQQCGVYQYGKRLYNIIKTTHNYIYREVTSLQDYLNVVEQIKPHIIIYNYHTSTMPWLKRCIMPYNTRHVGIPHESNGSMFDQVIEIHDLCRPLFICDPSAIKANSQATLTFIDYNEGPEVPIFGSFGFGFDNKGFHKIVELVNQQYDRAIIKLVIPCAHFDPNRDTVVQRMTHRCQAANVKHPNIKLMMIHEFLTDEEILLFLSKNTINLFMYDKLCGRGISSALDYAMSVNVPIGISDSYMFRHVYRDDICVYKTSLKDIMNKHIDIDPEQNNQLLCKQIEEKIR